MVRLPQPGGDEGQWGNLLNDFLKQAHSNDGTLKDGIVTTSKLAADAVNANALGAAGGSDGQVLVKDGSQPSGIAWRTPSASGPLPEASPTTRGIVQLAGDLGGTSSSPTVPALADKADRATTYTRTEVDNALAGKANTSALSAYIPNTQKGAANGVASLDATGRVPSAQLPAAAAQVNSDWNATTGVAAILNKPNLSAVATTGSYTSLTNRPTIPVNLDDLGDVNASNPADGQILSYSNASNGWVANTVTSTTVSDATTSEKGIVQLAGDLGGVAGAPTVEKIRGITLPTTAPTAGQVLTAGSGTTASWVTPAASGSGEANTASNVGTAGVGIYRQKTGVNLEFKRINAGSNRISVTDDTANNEVDIDVNVSNLGLSAVATSGSYTDLTNRPTIPAAQVNSDWNATSGVAQILNKPNIPNVTGTNTGDQTLSISGQTLTISGANGNSVTIPTGSATVDYSTLPAGTTLTVAKTGSTWPARPTNRNDIIVQWKGPDPSPTIVSSGTGGMLDNVDIRFVTP